ncbi:hypothetical protein EON68_04565, partial [archaeon]
EEEEQMRRAIAASMASAACVPAPSPISIDDASELSGTPTVAAPRDSGQQRAQTSGVVRLDSLTSSDGGSTSAHVSVRDSSQAGSARACTSSIDLEDEEAEAIRAQLEWDEDEEAEAEDNAGVRAGAGGASTPQSAPARSHAGALRTVAVSSAPSATAAGLAAADSLLASPDPIHGTAAKRARLTASPESMQMRAASDASAGAGPTPDSERVPHAATPTLPPGTLREVCTNEDLQPEPTEGDAAPTARLQLRLPDGRRAMRRFGADESLAAVFVWASLLLQRTHPIASVHVRVLREARTHARFAGGDASCARVLPVRVHTVCAALQGAGESLEWTEWDVRRAHPAKSLAPDAAA